MSTFDQELEEKIHEAHDNLLEIVFSMRGEHEGCRCDKNIMCAYHGEILDRLTEAIRQLEYATHEEPTEP